MDRYASNAPNGSVIALFKMTSLSHILERTLTLKNTDFLQLRAYTKSATNVRDRFLMAHFVELDPIKILEKTD